MLFLKEIVFLEKLKYFCLPIYYLDSLESVGLRFANPTYNYYKLFYPFVFKNRYVDIALIT